MKSILLISTLLLVKTCCYAQKDGNDGALKVTAGGTFGKPKILSGISSFAIPQATIYFKTATTRELLENERGAFGGRKSGGAAVAGRVTAYLSFTDAEPAAADYQKLADDFYSYLTGKLKARNINAVAWSDITSKEFYKNESVPLAEVQKDLDDMKRRGQVYHMANANNGNILLKYNIINPMAINTGFAFMKAKRAGSYFKELDAPGAFLHLVVDFADISLDGDVHTGTKYGYGAAGQATITKTKNFKMNSNVGAAMKVAANAANSTLYNDKMVSEALTVTEDIYADAEFATSVKEDPNMEKLRNKDNLFAKDFNMTPVVIETTKAAYMQAAAKALQAYADAFVGLIK